MLKIADEKKYLTKWRAKIRDAWLWMKIRMIFLVLRFCDVVFRGWMKVPNDLDSDI